MKSIYSPNEYKHLGSDSKMIQAAVDEAAKHGATVVIPRVNERTDACLWEIDEAIVLHTGSNILLENCYMRLVDDTYTNFFVNDATLGKWWKKETRNFDIKITGTGNALLDGGKPNDLIENNFTIYDENGNFAGRRTIHGFTNCFANIGILMQNVERVEISGIRFIRPRYWCINFEYCAWGHVHDIWFDADGANQNQDGCDIREGCHDFLVENLSGRTGDDMLALTNFGHPKRRAGGDDTDMDPDLHDIVVRNIRATMSHRCDIMRMLCRGESKIYNVQISGVQDTTPPEIWRPLAAIRIGDISDYQARLNRIGEMRNVTVRDVVTRARFGCYIANTLCDSYFENIQMVDDGGTGIYFNGCELENVTVKDLTYGALTSPSREDLDYVSKFHRVTLDSISAVYFKDCISAKNLRFENLRTAKEMDYAFGGNSAISLIAENTVLQNESTKLSSMAKVTNKE
jgi:hypothetical protein